MRANARRLADDVDIDMADAAAAFGEALDGEGQEAVRRRVAPLRIARREMHADIAVGQRAEDGIGERVQHDVGVGMADQGLAMRDTDATESDVIAGAESVHVDASAGAHVAKRCKLRGFGAREIVRVGDLDIAGLAGKDADLEAGPFGERGVVGEILAACLGRAAMGCEQRGEGEALRGLYQPQRVAVECPVDPAFGIDGLDRISDRQCRDGRPASFGRRDRARHQRRAGEWSGGVVDQDNIGLAGGERLEPGADRTLPGSAAEYRRKNIEARR